eukprot:CAMPEP_0172695648 /NCGR_PEP_ID=MMETSP1074-20121228/27497_1 /TAXON_ID=2916 /ORGANISM="Ceratium fusus, Strain PA161109" /LENGTH=501 /DNA_ID=CAMNT_0013516293 /DNA_START=82 /DNA_END=1584 /DNA_ORIENTATION=-
MAGSTHSKLDYARRHFTDEDAEKWLHQQKNCDYQEVDFSDNQLTSAGLHKVLDFCQRCENLRILKLFKNQINDDGADGLARLCERCPSLEELHLSHNKLTGSGVKRIVTAAEKSRSSNALPLWLRLEHNEVPDPISVLQSLRSFLSICDRRDDARCTKRKCAFSQKIHLPFFVQQKKNRWPREQQQEDTWSRSAPDRFSRRVVLTARSGKDVQAQPHDDAGHSTWGGTRPHEKHVDSSNQWDNDVCQARRRSLSGGHVHHRNGDRRTRVWDHSKHRQPRMRRRAPSSRGDLAERGHGRRRRHYSPPMDDPRGDLSRGSEALRHRQEDEELRVRRRRHYRPRSPVARAFDRTPVKRRRDHHLSVPLWRGSKRHHPESRYQGHPRAMNMGVVHNRVADPVNRGDVACYTGASCSAAGGRGGANFSSGSSGSSSSSAVVAVEGARAVQPAIADAPAGEATPAPQTNGGRSGVASTAGETAVTAPLAQAAARVAATPTPAAAAAA